MRARRAGKMVYYSPDDAHIRILLDITREHVRHREAGVRDGEATTTAVRLTEAVAGEAAVGEAS